MARITLNVSFSNLPKCLLMKKCIIFPITVWKIREFTLTIFAKHYMKSEYLLVNFIVVIFTKWLKSESKFLIFAHCAYMAIKTALEGGRSVRKKLVIYFDGIFDAYWRNLFLNFFNDNFSVGPFDANRRQDAPTDAKWRQLAKMRQQKD